MYTEDAPCIERTLNKIREYQSNGYLFHGSKDPNIEILEPRQATDDDPTNFVNNDLAIFASHNPEACIFALKDTSQVPLELRKGTIDIDQTDSRHITAKIPLEWEPYMKENTGTLYVLPPESFHQENDSWQAKSKVLVKPIEKIDVDFETFIQLGGILVWKENSLRFTS